MTTFNKNNFTWDGMYLMYEGEQGKYSRYYGENGETCHPTRKGTVKAMFIARFKYGSKPYKSWINFIVKNFTVEEWVELEKTPEHADKPQFGGMSPLTIMRTKGFMEPSEKKLCKKFGLAPTVENWGKAVNLETNRN